MKYMDVLLQELYEYKKRDDASPINYLQFAYDITYAEDRLNKGIIRELRWIETNTSKEMSIPLTTIEFVYQRHKKAGSTSREIIIRDNDGDYQHFFLSQLLRARQDAIREINRIIGMIVRKYDFNPQVRSDEDDDSGKDESEVTGLEDLKKAMKSVKR